MKNHKKTVFNPQFRWSIWLWNPFFKQAPFAFELHLRALKTYGPIADTFHHFCSTEILSTKASFYLQYLTFYLEIWCPNFQYLPYFIQILLVYLFSHSELLPNFKFYLNKKTCKLCEFTLSIKQINNFPISLIKMEYYWKSQNDSIQ